LRSLLYLLVCLYTLSGNAQPELDTVSFRSACKQLNPGLGNLVVIGETHEIRNTLSTEFFIIKQLAKEGYKTIFIEGGQSDAQILNSFLQTGDTALLKYTRAKEPTGTYKTFILSIYQLNKEQNYHLSFDAFDFERADRLHYLFTKWFDPSRVANTELKEQINQLLSIPDLPVKGLPVQSKRLQAVFEKVKKGFPKYEMQYREILGDDFEHFRSILYNPVFSDFAKRDARMCMAILEKAKNRDLSKSILIIGSQHVVEKDKVIPLLSALLPEKYSFTCFVFVYSNCQMMAGGKAINSKQSLLTCLGTREDQKPAIKFMKAAPKIIPTVHKNVSAIIVGFYNQ
jgi:hypothetical protein